MFSKNQVSTPSASQRVSKDDKQKPCPHGPLRFRNGERRRLWPRAGHVSPKLLEILIIQNGGKVAAAEELSPRQERKMADKTDVSLVQTSDEKFLYLCERQMILYRMK